MRATACCAATSTAPTTTPWKNCEQARLQSVTLPEASPVAASRWTSWRCMRWASAWSVLRRHGGGAKPDAAWCWPGRHPGAVGPARTAGAGRRQAAERTLSLVPMQRRPLLIGRPGSLPLPPGRRIGAGRPRARRRRGGGLSPRAGARHLRPAGLPAGRLPHATQPERRGPRSHAASAPGSAHAGWCRHGCAPAPGAAASTPRTRLRRAPNPGPRWARHAPAPRPPTRSRWPPCARRWPTPPPAGPIRGLGHAHVRLWRPGGRQHGHRAKAWCCRAAPGGVAVLGRIVIA
jgi:hypothetical protein